VVTGTHLSEKYGDTVVEIENDGYEIDDNIYILSENSDINSTTQTMGTALIKFGEYFEKVKPDLVVLLGDRYEILSVASAAVVKKIPIAHIHGGEITEAAYDDSFRHAITKMSSLHFPSCEVYAKRIIQMGEQPETVHTVGALGVENIQQMKLLDEGEIRAYLDVPIGVSYALVTYHPVTLENRSISEDLGELFSAMNNFPNIYFVITKANADDGGYEINELLDEYETNDETGRIKVFASLGLLRYLSAMKYCDFVLGNSSSGIIEAPSLGIPTVNIGDRQAGRIQAESIINSLPKSDEIICAIKTALDSKFQHTLRNVVNPYGKGDTSKKIFDILLDFLDSDTFSVRKKFFDIDCKY
jgi:GDP/UDP-N,N'-diacetylbacillosamine 2-epimerase (hydrolysing)